MSDHLGIIKSEVAVCYKRPSFVLFLQKQLASAHSEVLSISLEDRLVSIQIKALSQAMVVKAEAALTVVIK